MTIVRRRTARSTFVAALVLLALALSSCSTVSGVIRTQRALSQAGYRDPTVNLSATQQETVLLVRYRTSVASVAALADEYAAVARVVWLKAPLRFDTVQVDASGAPGSCVGDCIRRFDRITLTAMNGLRDPGLDKDVEKELLGAGLIILAVIAIALILLIWLLMRSRRKRRQREQNGFLSGAGYPPAGWPGGPLYPPAGWQGAPGGPPPGWHPGPSAPPPVAPTPHPPAPGFGPPPPGYVAPRQWPQPPVAWPQGGPPAGPPARPPAQWPPTGPAAQRPPAEPAADTSVNEQPPQPPPMPTHDIWERPPS
ncbi:MAG: hypothetical protein ABI912_03130 [Actinomycetota bacterium]